MSLDSDDQFTVNSIDSDEKRENKQAKSGLKKNESKLTSDENVLKNGEVLMEFVNEKLTKLTHCKERLLCI